MKKTLIVSFLTLLASGTAYAADAPPWNMSHDYNWQGVYFGVNAGYGWGTDSSKEYDSGGAPTNFSAGFDQHGGIEGFQAGYNIPLGEHVIFGADADWDNYDVSGGYRRLANGNGDDVEYDWAAGLRARLGVPLDNFLPYIDGGFAMSEIKDNFVAANTGTQDMGTVRFGWSIGAGAEMGLPENFTARLDYRYTEFASYTDTPSIVLPGYSYKQQPRVNTVTAGISYYFK